MGDQEPRLSEEAVSEALEAPAVFLGRGTYGDTWRAGSYAVKIICVDGYPLARVQREVQGLAAADSEFVVHLHSVRNLSVDGVTRTAMFFEYIDGGDVADRITKSEWPSSTDATAFLAGLLQGVAALHRSNTIHRDIKPANVALRDGDWSRPVLLDLGLAKKLGATTITVYPGHVGTYPYMAPEQLRAERARKAADLWSVGVTVREVLNRRHPFYEAGATLEFGEAIELLKRGPIALPDEVSESVIRVLDRLTSFTEYARGSVGSNLRILGGSA